MDMFATSFQPKEFKKKERPRPTQYILPGASPQDGITECNYVTDTIVFFIFFFFWFTSSIILPFVPHRHSPGMERHSQYPTVRVEPAGRIHPK